MSESKAVYKAINAVQADLAKDGITKDRRNAQQGYNFRGIDDVYNALAPLLAKHKLCILPRALSRIVTERESKHGGALFTVVVEAEFDFVSADDGSQHTVKTYGEAMDSADKATNKAMSAAYKYAAFQAFAIPTEGDNDADASHHEARPKVLPAEGWEGRDAGRLASNGPSAINVRQVLWDSLLNHSKGNKAVAGRTLYDLTGKRFFSEVNEAEAIQAQLKFESEYLNQEPGAEG